MPGARCRAEERGQKWKLPSRGWQFKNWDRLRKLIRVQLTVWSNPKIQETWIIWMATEIRLQTISSLFRTNPSIKPIVTDWGRLHISKTSRMPASQTWSSTRRRHRLSPSTYLRVKWPGALSGVSWVKEWKYPGSWRGWVTSSVARKPWYRATSPKKRPKKILTMNTILIRRIRTRICVRPSELIWIGVLHSPQIIFSTWYRKEFGKEPR